MSKLGQTVIFEERFYIVIASYANVSFTINKFKHKCWWQTHLNHKQTIIQQNLNLIQQGSKK